MDGVEGNPELIHRRIIHQGLDIHPSRKAIVVHYAVEAVVVSEYGEPMVADSKECVKIVNVKNLNHTTDIPSLAKQMVATCQLISPAPQADVEQLLLYMQARKTTNEGDAEADMLEASTKKLQKQMEDLESSEEASMVELDGYLEGLYDDLPAKIRATGLILQLARVPENLLELSSNDSLLLALSRVLRDDWRKSIDLTTNIIYVFFCFSTFSNFHKMLTRHKIGSSCISVVEHEIKRHRSLADDVAKRKKEVKSGATEAKKDYEKAKRKYQVLLKKQETLLRVCLYLLLNLAEDTRVELKMRNKALVPHLLTLLERDNAELLILAVSFLKKMSIFRENKDEMAEGEVIKKLAKMVPNKNEILVNVALRLLLNLSFDPSLRQEIVRGGFLPKLTALLGSESNGKVALCILYHISFDRKCRSVFAHTDCIPQLMKMILEYPEDLLETETIALGINLACTVFGAKLICKGPGLKLLLRRALKTRDPLLLKMIRNISQHPGPTKKLFLGYIPDLVELVKGGEGEREEGMVEALGILSNLNIPELDFSKVVRDLQLLPFLTDRLRDPGIHDDLLLEVVVLCGTFCQDEACAGLLVQAGLPDMLITLLKAKQEEDELVLQIVYVFYYLVLYQSTRQSILSTSQAPEYLLELLNDKNRAICKLCAKTLDIVAEENSELGQKIKSDKFRWHNSHWLEMMTGESLYEEEEEEEDEDYLDHYLLHSTAELDNPDYFFSTTDSTSAPVPMGEMGMAIREGYPLSSPQQYYTSGAPTHPPPGVEAGIPMPPHNSPYVNAYEGELGMSTGAEMNFNPNPLDPRSSAAVQSQMRVSNSLASPGMLFDAELDDSEVLSPQHYSARQLMPSMDDPLAMYSASLGASVGASVDLEREFVYSDSMQEEPGYAQQTYDNTEYPAVGTMSRGQYLHRSTAGGDRVGF